MAGQLIRLNGVRSAGIPGQARVTMDDGDIIAASIPSLIHTFSPKFSKFENGNFSAIDRTDGQPLSVFAAQGIQEIINSDSVFNNNPSLNIFAAGWGFSFAPGKVTESYTVVTVIAPDVSMLTQAQGGTNGTVCGILDGVNENWWANYRFLRSAIGPSTDGDGFLGQPSFGVAPDAQAVIPVADFQANVATIVVESYNHQTKTLTAYKDGTEALASITDANFPDMSTAQRETNRWQLGGRYEHISSGGMIGRLGDVYIFGDALDRSPTQKQLLGNLIDTLKTKYGV